MLKCHEYIVSKKHMASDKFHLIFFFFSACKILPTSFFIPVASILFFNFFLSKKKQPSVLAFLNVVIFQAFFFKVSVYLLVLMFHILPPTQYIPFSIYLQHIFILHFQILSVNFLMRIKNLLKCLMWV